MSKDLYTALQDAGIPTDHHESDLYFPATEEALTILNHYPIQKNNATFFRDNVTGDRWVDVPFSYEPFWQRAMERGSAGGLS